VKSKYHIEITQKALMSHFSQEAVAVIVNANIRQDRIKYQFGHDYIHFDGSAFKEGFEYIANLQKNILVYVRSNKIISARISLGRVLHSWQDFYSHSNYIQLWLENNDRKSPENIDWNDLTILAHSDLKSGRNYGVIEFFAMVPGLSKIITPLMPEDSHARMNMDSPEVSPHFNFVYLAALLRSKDVVLKLLALMLRENISSKNIDDFLGQ
jgi:hypothetical protein